MTSDNIRYYQNSTSTPTTGQNLGTIAFGTDVAPFAAYLQVDTYGNWNSNAYRGTKLEWYATRTTQVGPEMIYEWDNSHTFKGMTRIEGGNLTVAGGFSIDGNYQLNAYKIIASDKIEGEDLEINDDAVIAGDLTMGFGGQINAPSSE